LLAEYAEGGLAPAERRRVEEHLAACTACTDTLDDMQVALTVAHEVEEVAPPPRLRHRILEQTTGKLTWKQRMRLWARPVLEPRVAMGLAMALISTSIVLRSTGADLSHMSLADLSPTRIYEELDRRAHLASARVVKYYRDLRIVYEIQTQLQSIRETSVPPEEPKQQPPPQQQQPSQPKPQPQNKWSRQATYLAAGIL
jgi:anti-sigma factor RsiW